MAAKQYGIGLALTLALGIFVPAAGRGEDQEDLPPYKMLRSLQFVQDSVVLGDHSAGEMQSFMLTALDQRLRSADKSVFDDVRNVDAALVYTMSGGNPTTLEYLMSRDVNGNFDSRVADVLRKYLSGKGLLVVKTLADTATEYRDKKIGPYLCLVAANVESAKDPKAALKLYDWARLTAPGTIVEEAALRRSMLLTTQAGMVPEALAYSQHYVRRFLHSPYASQFADLFVQLVVQHEKDVKPDDFVPILAFMDPARQREVYLRIARQATIDGKLDLATLAADHARAIPGDDTQSFQSLATFYGNVANIPTAEVGTARRDIDTIPEGELNARDRALRNAAKAVADAVLEPPSPDSLTQASATSLSNKETTEHDPAAANVTSGAEAPQKASVPGEVAAKATQNHTAEGQDADSSFNSFVTTSRSKLDAIDGLLKQESK